MHRTVGFHVQSGFQEADHVRSLNHLFNSSLLVFVSHMLELRHVKVASLRLTVCNQETAKILIESF